MKYARNFAIQGRLKLVVIMFKLLIFLLKWFSKSFFAGNYQKNALNCTLSVAVDKKSSFILVLNLVPRTLEIAFQSLQISKLSGG